VTLPAFTAPRKAQGNAQGKARIRANRRKKAAPVKGRLGLGLAWVNLTRRARPRTTGSPRKRQAKGRLSRNRPFSSALPHIVCVPGISKPFRPFVIPEPTPSAQHIGKQLPSVSAALMLPRPKGFGFNGLAILARQGEAFAPFLRGLIGVKYGKRTNPKGSLPLPDPENARRVFPVDLRDFHG